MIRKPPPTEAPVSTLTHGGGGDIIKKSTSMLEMNVIRDIVRFGESIDASSGELGAGEPLKEAAADSNIQDGNEDVFIDSDDRQEGVDGADTATSTKLTSWSASLNAVDASEEVAAAQSPSRVGSNSGGMRRVMSVASLSSARMNKVQQEIHTITEEDFDCCESRKPIRMESIKNQRSEVGKQAAAHVVPELSPATKDDCRGPSRRHSVGSLRSSLKPSLKSTTNAVSMEDDSHHSMASCRSNNSLKSNVSFSSLEIRSYNVTLGDAPTARGPPVSLGWDYDASNTKKYDVDRYETYRAAEAPRRSRAELAISPMDRYWLLLNEAGCRRGEIQRAMDEAKRVMRQRERTHKGVKLGFVQPMEEALEKTQRKFSFGKKSPLMKGGKHSGGRRKE